MNHINDYSLFLLWHPSESDRSIETEFLYIYNINKSIRQSIRQSSPDDGSRMIKPIAGFLKLPFSPTA